MQQATQSQSPAERIQSQVTNRSSKIESPLAIALSKSTPLIGFTNQPLPVGKKIFEKVQTTWKEMRQEERQKEAERV